MILKVPKFRRVNLIIVQSQVDYSSRQAEKKKLRACEHTQRKALSAINLLGDLRQITLLISSVEAGRSVPSGA